MNLFDLTGQDWDLLEEELIPVLRINGFKKEDLKEVRGFIFREKLRRKFCGSYNTRLRRCLEEAFQVPFNSIPIAIGTFAQLGTKILQFRLQVGK